MAKDFKTPDKFIFNHLFANDSQNKEEIVVSDDPLRAYLGLYIWLTWNSTLSPDPSNVFNVKAGTPWLPTELGGPPNEAWKQYIDWLAISWDPKKPKSSKYKLYRPAPHLLRPKDDTEWKNLEASIISNLQKISETIKDKKVFEDFNFEIEAVPSLAIRTIVTKLSELDIKKDNPDFPTGDLEKNKDETSLKFAYAFMTIKEDGGDEIIAKKVDTLLPDSDDLMVKASNESLVTKIDQLKNLVYDGNQTSAIEQTVIDSKNLGSAVDIGIDKIYNIIEIDIPSIDSDPNDFLKYVEKHHAILNLPPYSYSSEKTKKDLATQTALTYFAKRIASPLSTEINRTFYEEGKILWENKNLDVISGFGADPGFDFDFYGLLQDEAAAILAAGNATSVPNSMTAQFALLKALENFNGSSIIPTPFADPAPDGDFNFSNFFNFPVASNAAKKLMEKLPFFPSDYWDMIGLSASPLEIILAGYPFREYPPAKWPLKGNYSISSLFKYARTDSSGGNFNRKLMYDDAERLSQLLKRGQLVGVRVVKSRAAYDPATSNKSFYDSIVQTFYITVTQGEDDKVIRLFDSQIAYGESYFYTLFGVYSVDGKFYYYDNVKMSTTDPVYKTQTIKTPSKFGSTPQKFENKVHQWQDKVHHEHRYRNPCCRFRDEMYNSWDNPSQGFTPSGGNYSKSWAAYQISAAWMSSGAPSHAQELWHVVRDLVHAANADVVGDADDKAQIAAIKKLQNSPWKDEIRCWLCRRNKLDNGQHALDFIVAGFKEKTTFGIKSKEDHWNNANPDGGKLEAIMDCRQFGYKNSDGTGGWKQPITKQKAYVAFAMPEGELEKYDGKPFKTKDEAYGTGNDLDGVIKELRCAYTWPMLDKAKVLEFEETTTKTDIIVTPEQLEEFTFDIKEMNSRRVYDLPLQPSADATILNFAPLPPEPTFVPLEDPEGKILIKFEVPAQTSFHYLTENKSKTLSNPDFQIEDGVINTLNSSNVYGKLLKKTSDYAKEAGIIMPQVGELKGKELGKDVLLVRSEQDIKEIHAYKLDRTPKDRSEIVEEGEKFVLDFLKGKTAYFSNLKPNQKYYYIFATRDITGLYSGGTKAYEVEIVEDSGYSYTKVNVYEFPKDNTKQTTKSFKKLLKIKPSFEELLPHDKLVDGTVGQHLGTHLLFSTMKVNGSALGGLNRPPKFKIRIRSKKTKRVFDINIKYTQDVKEILSKRKLREIKAHSKLIDEKKA